MPDRYGFDHLGHEVRCIDCPSGGPLWQWPEQERYQHALTHTPAPTSPTEIRRRRNLLAAPPTNHNEETKGATTMAPNTPNKPEPAGKDESSGKGESAKQVTIDVLRTAGEPLHAKEIAKRVIDSGRCSGLKGKTPEATIAALLAVGSKPGGLFTRIDKGTYTLAGAASTSGEQPASEPQPTAAAAKTTQARKPTQAKRATASR